MVSQVLTVNSYASVHVRSCRLTCDLTVWVVDQLLQNSPFRWGTQLLFGGKDVTYAPVGGVEPSRGNKVRNCTWRAGVEMRVHAATQEGYQDVEEAGD
jgi:hypothetical protein